MLVSTKDMLVKAQKEHYAVANFCIWNVEMLSGVVKACEKLQSPVILSFGSGFPMRLRHRSPAPSIGTMGAALK